MDRCCLTAPSGGHSTGMLQGAASFREQPTGTSASVSGSHSRSSCPRPIRRPTAWWDTSAPKKLRTGKPPSTLSLLGPSLPSLNHSRSRISSRTIRFHTTSTKRGPATMKPGLRSSTKNWDANPGRTPSWEWVSAASKLSISAFGPSRRRFQRHASPTRRFKSGISKGRTFSSSSATLF